MPHCRKGVQLAGGALPIDRPGLAAGRQGHPSTRSPALRARSTPSAAAGGQVTCAPLRSRAPGALGLALEAGGAGPWPHRGAHWPTWRGSHGNAGPPAIGSPTLKAEPTREPAMADAITGLPVKHGSRQRPGCRPPLRGPRDSAPSLPRASRLAIVHVRHVGAGGSGLGWGRPADHPGY